ncbi:MAG: 4Fe-4S binding protein [Spirochaetes bacterium]|nr:4Fe-4S binding protein [Spirochaetota bacterium]
MKYLKNAATLTFDPDRCTGCRRCVEVCPHCVFEMHDGKARITDKDRCMECGACALNCEFGAISVGSGVGCAAAIIRSMITGGEPTCDCGAASSGAKTTDCC